jgi:two-component system sensor histidine kinase KdpD
VLVVASRFARLPSLAAAIVSVAALDFFFVSPEFTFAVADLRYMLTFVVMLLDGVTVSSFTVRLREQAAAAQQRERRTAALYAMSRQFVIETGVGEIAATATLHVRGFMETEAFVLLADRAGNLSPCGGTGTWVVANERELAVARWVHVNGRLAGYGTDTLPASECLYIPLVGTAGHIGVFGVALARRSTKPTPFQWQTLETFVAQTALAIERALLVERSAVAQVAMETERTRGELLSAVTHDIRTPLTSIRGAAETLLGARALDEPTRRAMLETIRDESQRLSRMIGDLLDLTRIESGALVPRRELCPLEEIVDSALDRTAPLLVGREIVRDSPHELTMVSVDEVLLEQVFVNLIENAAKYSPERSRIEIRVFARGAQAFAEVADRGPGIPRGEEERIFERFYRAGDGMRAGGTGLGLTVSRAIVKVHGGTLRAENREDGGALFRVALALEAARDRAVAVS